MLIPDEMIDPYGTKNPLRLQPPAITDLKAALTLLDRAMHDAEMPWQARAQTLHLAAETVWSVAMDYELACRAWVDRGRAGK